jgi:membrane-bound metal-dependent hydrolase YbcI (DUF457 family)
MMGRSHLVLAGAAYAALTIHPLDTPVGTLAAPVLGGLTTDPWATILASLLVAAACGLAPDIDKRSSWAARSLGLPTRALSWGIEHSFGHRGAFHSLLAAVLAYVLGNLAGGMAGLTGLGGLIAFGWAVHLLTDAWTVHGIPFFWPVPVGRLRLEAVMLILSLAGLAAYALLPYLLPYLGA